MVEQLEIKTSQLKSSPTHAKLAEKLFKTPIEPPPKNNEKNKSHKKKSNTPLETSKSRSKNQVNEEEIDIGFKGLEKND